MMEREWGPGNPVYDDLMEEEQQQRERAEVVHDRQCISCEQTYMYDTQDPDDDPEQCWQCVNGIED